MEPTCVEFRQKWILLMTSSGKNRATTTMELGCDEFKQKSYNWNKYNLEPGCDKFRQNLSLVVMSSGRHGATTRI